MIDVRTADQMEWLQDAIFYGMASCDLFANLNLVQEKKFRADSEIQMDAIWTTPRGNGSGAGLIVEMPKLVVENPNSLVNKLVVSAVVIEERNVNGSAAGTGKTAEQWAQIALEFLRGWIVGSAGGLVVETNAVVPADDWIGGDNNGIIALRASVSQKISRPNLTRCATPVIAYANGLVTLTAASGAEIWFTTDGTMPRNCPGDNGELPRRYVAPFAAAAGTLVQAIALEPGKLPSHIAQQLTT